MNSRSIILMKFIKNGILNVSILFYVFVRLYINSCEIYFNYFMLCLKTHFVICRLYYIYLLSLPVILCNYWFISSDFEGKKLYWTLYKNIVKYFFLHSKKKILKAFQFQADWEIFFVSNCNLKTAYCVLTFWEKTKNCRWI